MLILKETALHQEIVEAMRHPQHGLNFLSPHTSLPGHVFVSADAVSWVKTHIENKTTFDSALTLLKVNLIVVSVLTF